MFEKLKSYAARQLELDPSEITPDSTFESLGIDSLDVVEMIMDLESELGVELDMEDQKITTFQEPAELAEKIRRSAQTQLRGVALKNIKPCYS